MAGSALRSREQKTAFYRGVLRSGGAVAHERIDDLAADLARRTSQVWLWDAALADEMSSVPPSAAAFAPAPQTEAQPGTTSAPAAPEAVAAPAFDPFAFSAVVVLTRQGKAALLKRLASIDTAANLIALADAQHLAIDRSLTDLARLREAIVKGAEQRIADRRAAAS